MRHKFLQEKAMSKRNDFIWKAIQTICWLIFAGYCVQTGTLAFNYIFSLFKPVATHNLHLGFDLSDLYSKSKEFYTVVMAVAITMSALKAYLLYLAIRLFRSLDIVKPFSGEVHKQITTITYYTFLIGIISVTARELVQRIFDKAYAEGFVERYWNDGGAYLVMSAIMFVIVVVFQRGIELQNENDLTV